ncbi:MAG: 4Fe-4S dicluster domain-containing protein [Rhodocyclales bacterium]|nr:4Fe-4S dicluster domain-containing protein [Rhodocyclales bacterium]
MTDLFPQFHTARCVRYRYRYSECRRCAEACPHEAVELLDEGIRIDPARCQNCVLCTTACPTAALASDKLPRIELLKRAIKQEGFSFACAPSGEAADALLPCLGALDAAMLAYLAKRRIAVELRGAHHCATCPHAAKGAAQLDANLDGAAALEEAAAPEAWIAPRLVEPEDRRDGQAGFRAGRRQLFRRLIGRGVDEVARATAAPNDLPVEEKAIRAGAWFVPEMRELLQIVCRRKEGGTFAVRPHPALAMAGLRLRRGCTACEACFRICPTGAIQIREDQSAWELLFVGERCVACRACLEVCQPHALLMQETFDAATGCDPALLRQLAKQRCDRCDRFFVSPEPRRTCPVCADDDDAFSAIFGG